MPLTTGVPDFFKGDHVAHELDQSRVGTVRAVFLDGDALVDFPDGSAETISRTRLIRSATPPMDLPPYERAYLLAQTVERMRARLAAEDETLRRGSASRREYVDRLVEAERRLADYLADSSLVLAMATAARQWYMAQRDAAASSVPSTVPAAAAVS